MVVAQAVAPRFLDKMQGKWTFDIFRTHYPAGTGLAVLVIVLVIVLGLVTYVSGTNTITITSTITSTIGFKKPRKSTRKVMETSSDKETSVLGADNLRLRGLQPGAVIGPFTLIRLLGTGGMGAVYLAEQKSPQRPVALKVMTKISGQAPVQRFLREAEFAAGLDHPGIVKVYTAGLQDDIPYLAMEYVPGESLEEYVQARSAGIDRILCLIKDVAGALDYAHEKGIVHRDVKPSNILVTPEGNPKIMDFGIARTTRIRDKKLTRTGEILGTPEYMAPEQVRGARDIDGRADVYSLGCVLYRLVTGRPVFLGSNNLQLLYQVLNAEPASPREVSPLVPEAVEAIVLKSIDKDRDRRYQRPLEMAHDIDEYVHGRAVKAVGAIEGRRAAQRKERYRRRAAIIALSLMAAVSILSLLRIGYSRITSPAKIDGGPALSEVLEQLPSLAQRLEKEPSAQLYRQYVDILQNSGRYWEAMEQCREAVHRFGENAGIALEFEAVRARLLLLAGEHEKSYDLCRDIYARRQLPEIYLCMAQAALGLGKTQEVAAMLEKMDFRNLPGPLQGQYLFIDGGCRFREFLAGTRQASFLREVAGKSENFTSSALLAQVISRLTEAEGAAAGELQKDIRAYLGYALLCRGEWEKAKKYLEGDPGTGTIAREARAVRCYCEKEYPGAMGHFSACIEEAPWEDRYYHFRAQSRVQERPDKMDMDLVVDDCMKAVELDPSNESPLDTVWEAMVTNARLEEFFDIHSIMVDSLLLARDPRQMLPCQLWEPEYRSRTSSWHIQPPRQVEPQKIDELIQVLQNAKIPATIQLAQDNLSDLWQSEEAKDKLETAKAASSSETKARIAAIAAEMEKKELAYRRQCLDVAMKRLFQGRDQSACALLGERAYLEMMANILSLPTEEVLFRYWVARVLMELKSPEALEILRQGERSADPTERFLCRCVQAQAGLPVSPGMDETALEALPAAILPAVLHNLGPLFPAAICANFFRHPSDMVRATAARAVLCRCDPGVAREAAAILSGCSRSAEEKTRCYVCQWLWAPEYFGALQEILLTEQHVAIFLHALDQGTVLEKLVAANAISELAYTTRPEKHREAVHELTKALQALLDGPNEKVRLQAILALLYLAQLNIPLAQEDPYRIALLHCHKEGETFANRGAALLNSIWQIPVSFAWQEKSDALLKELRRMDPVAERDVNFAVLSLFFLLPIASSAGTNAAVQHALSTVERAMCAGKREIRLAGAMASVNLQDPGFLDFLRQRLDVEPEEKIRCVIAGSIVHLGVRLKSPWERRFLGELENLPAYRQSAAYGYYSQLVHYYPYYVDKRGLQLTSVWGRDHEYLLRLEGILYNLANTIKNGSRRMQRENMPAAIESAILRSREIDRFLAVRYRATISIRQFLPEQCRSILATEGNLSPEQQRTLQRLYLANHVLEFLCNMANALELDQDNARYHFIISFLLEFLGETDAAARAIDVALGLKPDRHLYQMVRARLCLKSYLKHGRTDDLERARLLVEEIRKERCSLRLLHLQGQIYMAMGEYRQAERIFTREYLIVPHLSEPLVSRAQSRMCQGLDAGAQEDLEQAWKLLEQDRRRAKRLLGLGQHYRYMPEADIQRVEGHYWFARGRLSLRGKNTTRSRREAVEYCRKGYDLFAGNSAHCGQNPFTLENLGRYPEFKAILQDPVVAKFPVSVHGLVEIK